MTVYISYIFRDDDHVTPLHQAARVGCTSTTEFLLNNGAKIDATNKNRVRIKMLIGKYRKGRKYANLYPRISLT